MGADNDTHKPATSGASGQVAVPLQKMSYVVMTRHNADPRWPKDSRFWAMFAREFGPSRVGTRMVYTSALVGLTSVCKDSVRNPLADDAT